MAVTNVWKVLAVLVVVAVAGLGWATLRSDDGNASIFDADGMVDPGNVSPRESRFSPDGKHLAVRARGVGASRLLLAEGGRLRLLPTSDLDVAAFAWMPDSSSLLVAHEDESLVAGLAVINLDGEIVREVPLSERLSITEGMAVRGDGSVAVVPVQPPVQAARPTDLVEVDLATGATHKLTDTPVEDEAWPVFVEDGRLLFAGGQLTTDFGGPNGYIAVLDLADGSVRRLTPEDHVASQPTVSPDGSLVVYEAFVDSERRTGGLWQVPVDGSSEPFRIVREDVRWPWFRSDGRALVVTEVGTPGRPGGPRLIELEQADPGTA